MKRGTTFESATKRLDEILALLSDEQTPLNQSLQLYAEAAELIAFCNDTLKRAQITVDEIDATLQITQRGDDNDV